MSYWPPDPRACFQPYPLTSHRDSSRCFPDLNRLGRHLNAPKLVVEWKPKKPLERLRNRADQLKERDRGYPGLKGN